MNVALRTPSGTIVAQTTTDAYGAYKFEGVGAGSYYVTFTSPSGYSFTTPNAGSDDSIDSDINSSGQTATFTVTSTSDLTVDAGLVPSSLGSIAGKASFDADNDGVRDSGESAATGVVVKLYTSDGYEVASTTTNSSGNYTFSSVAPGDYYVSFATPSDYVYGPLDIGGDDTVDSDVYQSGATNLIALAAGQNKTNVDAGLVQSASVGDYVWVDDDDDGIQDAGEEPLAYAEVSLYTSVGDLVATTLSDGDGFYQFTDLVPGDYYLVFAAPSGYRFSDQDQGSDDSLDSDADGDGQTANFTLQPGVDTTNVDLGLVPVPESGTIGDRVWVDTNGNGSQDFDEPGLQGVTVRLLSSTNQVLATTTTDADGLYQFTGVVPGDYRVEFVRPTGRTFTTSSADEDEWLDSDADVTTGRTALFTLELGETRDDLDAGLLSTSVQYGSVGNLVWLDSNRDGLQGTGPTGIADIGVHLLDAQGYWLRSTVTSSTGAYSFVNVPPGTYMVQFSLPEGYRFTPRDQGSNDAADSDADPTTGRTSTFAVGSGAAVTTIDAGAWAVPPAPRITSLSPNTGYTSGGQQVTITGTDFTYVEGVYFAGVPALSFTVVSATQIIAVTPPYSAGTFDVKVLTPGGVSNGGRFNYQSLPAPSILSLDVTSGPTAGGTVVRINGIRLTGASSVTFGGTPAAKFTVNSDTSITAISPARPVGPVFIRVRTPTGDSELTSAGVFTYVYAAPPTVTLLRPPTGPVNGGTSVTITGTGFTAATEVRFGTVPAGFRVLNATTIVATSPAGVSMGVVNVYVRNGGGLSAAAAANQFEYTESTLPTVTGVSPNVGSTYGGTTVLLTGTNFINVSRVRFGAVEATFSVISAGAIRATVPAGSVGAVNVYVTTAVSTSAPASANQYTYTAPVKPTLSSISPNWDHTYGGKPITINGSDLQGVQEIHIGTYVIPRYQFTIYENTISLLAPPHGAGTFNVLLRSPEGYSALTANSRFTYRTAPRPAVTSISPTGGYTYGGTAVTINGSNFLSAPAVTFGGLPATVTSWTPTRIVALSPPRAQGLVDVRVTTLAGISAPVATGRFLYNPAPVPTVLGLSVTSGPTGGGTYVAVHGAHFTAASVVRFGNVAAPPAWVTVVSPNLIRVYSPAHPAALVNVRVTTPSGTSAATNANRFTYVQAPAPTVTRLAPNYGPTTGGNIVMIIGTNFGGASVVKFGNRVAHFVLESPTLIRATAPPGAAGWVHVTVTTPSGTSSTSGWSQYGYEQVLAPGPNVNVMNFRSGAAAGGRKVVITGTNFAGATDVAFGTTPATSFTVDSPTKITAVVPAGSAGTVDVTVTTNNGTSSATAASQFTYLAAPAPAVTSLDTATGSTAGGATIVLTGTDFTNATAVLFGGVPAASFTVDSDTQITAVAPALYSGAADLTVLTPSGVSEDTSADDFTYVAAPLPTLTSLSATSGSTAGGATVVLTGTDFTGATAVLFGGAPAASFTVDSDTQITAVAPASFTATVDVLVVTTAGDPDPDSGLAFEYTLADPPEITSLSAASGSTAGGESVTITGTGFTGVLSVSFGGVEAAFTVVSATEITAVAPPQADGTVHVTVTTTAGGSTASEDSDFTYEAAPEPTITSLGTGSGSSAGGDTVVITGTNLLAATAVLFGGVPALSFTVDSATQITAVAPPQAAGTVDVTVITTAGSSTPTAGGEFTYEAAPAPEVGFTSPSTASSVGGDLVAVMGSDFTGAFAVSFGGVPAAWFEVVSDSVILTRTPAHAPGLTSLVVWTPSGSSSSGDFLFVGEDAPTATALDTASGPTGGGTQITIEGTGFLGATSVTVGGVAASFVALSDTSLLVTTPPMPAGTYDLVVSAGGAASAPARFAYGASAAPGVTGLSAPSGSTAGGTVVTITGSGFLGASAVLFGSTSASFTVVSDTSIEAVAPSAAAAGTVDVVVLTPTGSSEVTEDVEFTYEAADAPAFMALSIVSGGTAGGSIVYLEGERFTGATAVLFGNVAATFTVLSDTLIVATAPVHDAGPVAVEVTSAGGTSPGRLFTYEAPDAPVVTGMTPASDATTGGDTVVLLGSGFLAATAVKFGAVDATSFQILSDHALSVVVPAGAAGAVHVTVTTAGGTSETTSADEYTYVAASTPEVTALSALDGSTGGGSTVVITGTGLAGATQVLFGGVAATFVVNSDTQVTALAPSQAAGAVHVTVTTGAGSAATSSADEFTYTAAPAPAVSVLGQTAGPLAGGNTVLVRGTNFLGATGVSFGAVSALSFTVLSDTELFAVAPAGTGTVHVTVTTPSGTSSTSSADQYSYRAVPTITSLSATTDAASGGILVTITGTDLAGATAVYFDGAAADTFLVVSATSIKVVVPAQAGAGAQVRLVAPGGFSNEETFTYTAASVVVWVGATGDWETASNWDTNALPTAGQDVVIPTDGVVTYSGTGGAATVHRLTVQGSLVVSAAITVTGTATLDGGSLIIDGGGSLAATSFVQSGGATAVEGVLSAAMRVTQTAGTLNLAGGEIEAGAGVLIGEDAQFNGYGTITGDVTSAGSVVLGESPGSGSATIDGSYTQTGGATSVVNDLTVTGTLRIEAGTLDHSGGLLDVGGWVQTGGAFSSSGGLMVAGNFRLEGGTANLDLTSGTVSGQVLVNGGLMSLAAGAALTVTGSVQIAATGALDLGGTLSADVVNAGILLVRGDATIDGDYTQSSTGRLVMHTSGTATDKLTITGHAALDGAFELIAEDGYQSGVQLIEYGSHSGTFDELFLPELGEGTWEEDYQTGGFYLDIDL